MILYLLPRCFYVLALLIMAMPLMSFADATDTALPVATPTKPLRLFWNKTPIALTLVVGEERLVHFPDSVSVGVPDSLTASLRSQSIHGTVYLKAHQAFETRRLLVRSESSGPIYVLDVSARLASPEQPLLPDIQIQLPHSVDQAEAVSEATYDSPAFGYIGLTRFAAQQLYAPSRLLHARAGVVSVPVATKPLALVRGGQVEATPIAAWRAGRLQVTAIRLVNTSQQAVVLDPRHLRGQWLAATFQHNRLHKAGSDAATTLLYVISERDLALNL